MEKLIGENIKVLPFKELKKVYDLIFFEGPILSHFKDRYGKNILYYWVDTDEKANRWLVFQVSEDQLYRYLAKRISLRTLVESPLNDIYYSLEIGDKLEYKNIMQIFTGDLNETYLPEKGSFFDFDLPSNYSKKIHIYEEDFLMETFLDRAAFIKAEPKKKRSSSHGLIDVFGASDVLKAYGDSYKGMLIYNAQQEFYQRGIVDKKRINTAAKRIYESSPLNLVKAGISSFAIAFCPNTILDFEESFLNKSWRDGIFEKFKSDVIEIDNKSEEYVNKIIETYGDNFINDIYKPVIDLYDNKDIEINITDENFVAKRVVRPIKKEIVAKLIRKRPNAEPEDRLAMVKFNKRTGRIWTVESTLFDQSIQTSWSADEIRAGNKTYKLRHKLFAEYSIDNGLHILEMELLNIYATGDSFYEAEINFYYEFDLLYTELTSKENKDLTYEQIEAKNFLLFYVKG